MNLITSASKTPRLKEILGCQAETLIYLIINNISSVLVTFNQEPLESRSMRRLGQRGIKTDHFLEGQINHVAVSLDLKLRLPRSHLTDVPDF